MLRSFFRQHHALAALVVAAALALKALIPGGYMIASAGGFMIVPCPTAFGAPASTQASPTPAAQHDHHAMMGHGAMTSGDHAHHAAAHAAPAPDPSDHSDHAAAQQACPYAVLSLASLAGADPIQLAAALAFVMALAFTRRRLPDLAQPQFLRPPLRGPPAQA